MSGGGGFGGGFPRLLLVPTACLVLVLPVFSMKFDMVMPVWEGEGGVDGRRGRGGGSVSGLRG